MKLNRVRKNLIILMLIACLAKPALAANDSTISYVSINDKVYYDVELMITDKSEILIPFKQFADLFEIEYSANRVDKHIQFKTLDGKDGVINQNGVFVQDMKIQKNKPIFLQQGIMDNIFNEAYIEASTANKIFGANIEPDFSSITVSASVDRNLKALKDSKALAQDYNAPRAHQDVALPKKNKVISLNKVGLRSNFRTYNSTTDYRHYKTDVDYTNGNSMLSVYGNAFSGKYRVDATAFHYDSDAFLFGGLSATYMNKFTHKNTGNNYWYELGKVKGFYDVDSRVGSNIFGAQIWNYEYNRVRPKELNGYVKPTSLVRVTVNDNEPVTLSTYAGYYTLKDMNMGDKVKTIKIEEINEDGTIEVVREEKYPQYGDRPFMREERGSVYAGVWGYQNRLFREGRDIYFGNNKKVTAGANYQYGIKDNVTFDAKITADKIYDKTSSKTIYTMPTNDTLLTIGTQKNVNYQEGVTSMNSIDYVSKKDPNLKLRGTAGASIAHD